MHCNQNMWCLQQQCLCHLFIVGNQKQWQYPVLFWVPLGFSYPVTHRKVSYAQHWDFHLISQVILETALSTHEEYLCSNSPIYIKPAHRLLDILVVFKNWDKKVIKLCFVPYNIGIWGISEIWSSWPFELQQFIFLVKKMLRVKFPFYLVNVFPLGWRRYTQNGAFSPFLVIQEYSMLLMAFSWDAHHIIE